MMLLESRSMGRIACHRSAYSRGSAGTSTHRSCPRASSPNSLTRIPAGGAKKLHKPSKPSARHQQNSIVRGFSIRTLVPRRGTPNPFTAAPVTPCVHGADGRSLAIEYSEACRTVIYLISNHPSTVQVGDCRLPQESRPGPLIKTRATAARSGGSFTPPRMLFKLRRSTHTTPGPKFSSLGTQEETGPPRLAPVQSRTDNHRLEAFTFAPCCTTAVGIFSSPPIPRSWADSVPFSAPHAI